MRVSNDACAQHIAAAVAVAIWSADACTHPAAYAPAHFVAKRRSYVAAHNYADVHALAQSDSLTNANANFDAVEYAFGAAFHGAHVKSQRGPEPHADAHANGGSVAAADARALRTAAIVVSVRVFYGACI